MLIMSRPFKCIYTLQNCLRTLATLRCSLRCSLPSVCIRTREFKWSHVNQCPTFRIATSPCRIRLFSTDISQNDTCVVLQSQDEENSDSDDNAAQDEDILVSVITKGKQLSSSEWEAIKDQVVARKKGINSYNIDAVIIGLCTRFMQLDIGLSYLEHLSVSGKELNVASIAQVMKMCYSCRVQGIDEELILSMYENLRSRCPVLDVYTAESAILGLCLTRHWKVGLDLLDMAKLTSTPGGMEYNVLVKAAYDNNEPDVSRRLMTEMIQLGRTVRPEVFHARLDYCERMSAGNGLERWKMVEELLSMLVEHDLKLTVDVAERIKVWYLEAAGPDAKVQAELSAVTDGGICKSCQKYLNPITITKEEFGALQSAFMDRVVVGADIFRKSTPEEIKEFKNFVKVTAPFDMVIDGLNIAFTAGPKKSQSSQVLARTLHHVVKYFVMKSKKVLVLGRKHMQTWPPRYMDYIYRNAHVFLAQNLSQDDPLLLYAALYGGMGTKFLSRDLMRGHAYRLQNQNLRSTFRRWQLQHQCQLKYVTEAGKVHLKLPLSFNPMAQVSRDGSWHIPYEMEYIANPPQSFEPPSAWLCLRSAKSSPSLCQNRTNSEMEVQDPCGDTNPTSCDASQAINIKVEEVSDAEEEAGPVPITFPEIKAEPENNTNSAMEVRDAFGDMNPTPHGASQAINIKVEEVSDAEEEAVPVPITFIEIKAEPEGTLTDPQEEGQYFCNVCNKPFTEQKKLKRHQRIHSGERPFSCHTCNKSFSEQSHLKTHQRIHSGERPFTCDVCKKSFSERSSLKKHLLIHSGEQPFCCNVCNKSFGQQSSLKTHQRIHSGEQPFSCDTCNKSFSQQSNLKKHLLIHSGEQPFCCNVCNKSFGHQSSLKTHQRIHNGEQPFSCDTCNKSFSQQSNLKKHQRIHSGDRPFTCDVCKKSFSERGNLKTHQRIHSGEQPFRCNVCNKSFGRQSSLKKHLLIHNG